MTHDDAIWSYAEEFADKIMDCKSQRSADPVIEEIAELMSCEMNKRDRNKVMEKLTAIMDFKISEGQINKAIWNKVQTDLTALLGL